MTISEPVDCNFLHRAQWHRRSQPILSAMASDQNWSKVQLYNPTVVFVDGTYKMWYLGNSSLTRRADMDLGIAESLDGINWTAHNKNPIMKGTDLPFGSSWQTPHVIFDSDENIYKMWFIMASGRRTDDGFLVDNEQKLGYAISSDGLEWDVHPKPIYSDGRRPFVIKDGPKSYRMWMNSTPHPNGSFEDLVSSIYRFVSADGIDWIRDPNPVITSNDKLRSVIYPCIIQNESGYVMWYGSHLEEGTHLYEIFCSTSLDGLVWEHHHDRSAFSATRNPNDFDGRYTSTPCVLDDGDRYLMYYSTRDCGNLYRAGDGSIMFDRAGIYRHIGVAVCQKSSLSI